MSNTSTTSINPVEFWNQRYGQSQDLTTYGTEPNDFLKETWPTLEFQDDDEIECLCLGEGEGRNAVWMARQNAKVTAVDLSPVGLAKAQSWAKTCHTTISTHVADLADYDLGESQWDAVVLIFCHVPPTVRTRLLENLPKALKPGGYIILEAYTPQQLEYKTGGPPTVEPTYSKEMLQEAFSNKNVGMMEILRNEELVRDVVEGTYHTGKGAVVQFVARRKTTTL